MAESVVEIRRKGDDLTDLARTEKQFWRGSACVVADDIATVTGDGWQASYELFPARWWDSPEDAVDVYLAKLVDIAV